MHWSYSKVDQNTHGSEPTNSEPWVHNVASRERTQGAKEFCNPKRGTIICTNH